MIRLNNVSKVYTTKRGPIRAVDELSLEVEAGQYVAVRGPSGCGKSTLLSLVGGLALPTSGEVFVDQREVSALSPSGRARFRGETIGFVFQMFHLLPYLNVLNNVLVAARVNGDHSVRERAEQLLQRIGLGDRKDHRPGRLSAGERQRAALARAMINQPKVILADEPTGNLDPDNAAIVLDLLAEYHRSGGTLLLVTHDESAAAQAQRVIYLDHGRLVKSAPGARVKNIG
jgi:ABC-type lipoprotein export system ATPase subunit